ncbi:hypothetical protein Z517_04129 [Fonsecaea pedrosoi CBS 271.37]|uniref:Unplaced genomic scaffold supercont1.3, whole genome shotgun sequence n=1 Tax=Fonsecaea pedrosoi CBS 271.37 TaxID=1442368 RepID=A0A0D2DTK6_9EURO|nr:uncharacterized protein Z517_04129 [Fonsecaea pedrosoi CBS 271.37]KIW81106.1 hypothetical protein Z517_04129 [Fonsecaea pedrosoi CBS 271.37]
MPASKESQILVTLYNGIKERMMASPPMSIQDQRALLESLHEPASEPTDVTYEEVRCPGTQRPAIWCKPLDANPSQVILYLHGGAGFAGSPSSHRKLAGHLAKAAKSLALVIDYRLVPENPFPAALDDAVAAYQWLLSKGFDAKNLAVAGDSAGGNFATASVLKLKQLGIPLPAAVVAFSPWVDMETKGESQISNADKDALSPPGVANITVSLYLGDKVSPKEPLANPLYADFTGMPPFHISVGGWELLMSDGVRLAHKIREANVEAHLEVAPEMQHVYHFMAGRAPEADRTISEVGEFLRSKFGI